MCQEFIMVEKKVAEKFSFHTQVAKKWLIRRFSINQIR